MIIRIICILAIFVSEAAFAVSWNVKACSNHPQMILVAVDSNGYKGDYLKDVSFKVKIDGVEKYLTVPNNKTLGKGTLHIGYYNMGAIITSVEKKDIAYTPTKSGLSFSCAGDCTPPKKLYFTEKLNDGCK